jgi:hypothetical protein
MITKYTTISAQLGNTNRHANAYTIDVIGSMFDMLGPHLQAMQNPQSAGQQPPPVHDSSPEGTSGALQHGVDLVPGLGPGRGVGGKR